ncbi:unnamed protein product [Microthlaspi erraticum]|uniref:Reverse transcriptase domain-containing protein n=1 Tax=Microthlaspi erraticum TaxID=1685480 RepID=A0A6D2I6D4_9BRAS|nr:unnamed protein product [Microthlaspi erraticum]
MSRENRSQRDQRWRHSLSHTLSGCTLEDVEEAMEVLPQDGFEKLTPEEKRHLDKEFLSSEIESAVRGIGKFKAPGPDGYQPVFYQSGWETVGPSVTRFVLDFFTT